MLKTLVRLPLRVVRRIKRMVFGTPASADSASSWPVEPPAEAPAAPVSEQPPVAPAPPAPQEPVAAAAAPELEAPKKRARKAKEPGEEKPKARGKKKAEPEAPKVTVRPEATPNPNAMKFVASTRVVEKGSVSFNNATVAAGHPLGEALFQIPGVRMVFAVNDFVTITKEESVGWESVQSQVEAALARVLGG